MLGRGVFKQRLINLDAEIARQQLDQDLFLVGLVIVNRVAEIGTGVVRFRQGCRDELTPRQNLRHDRLKAIEDSVQTSNSPPSNISEYRTAISRAVA